jgi:2-methylcitrate dehydratase PrpD
MANAAAAHAIEFDDTHNAASLHPGVVIFPASTAAALIADADDATFMLGVVVGYETMCRIGRAINPSSHYQRHFHPTGTVGHFGAAASAARILGLGPETTTAALGIAATMAAGSMEFLVDGAWTKRIHPALAARNGIEAALLASEGFVAPADGIGGPRGFLASYSANPNPDLVLAGFGEMPLEVRSTSIKAHTCCRYNQGPIDAILELRGAHNLSADDVTHVKVGMVATGLDIVWDPPAAKRRPHSVVDAQFSMPFAAAVAIAHGRAALQEYSDSQLADPRILRLMDATECVHDAELDRTFPRMWRAWAEVETKDGRTVRTTVDYPKGDPENAFTPRELRAKFASLAEPAYGADGADLIAAAADKIPDPGSLSALLALL